MNLSRIGVVVHDGKPAAVRLRDELGTWLGRRGAAFDQDDPGLILSLGGDGTMLRAAQLAHQKDVPLLGINLGSLGYLTEVDEGGAHEALEQVLTGDIQIEERMMLECSIPGSGERFVGLNEVLVERASQHRIVRFGIGIGGESFTDFNADGVIVATPTGSTAYAMSAGGPIVSPRAECIVVVPVSAHIIFSRPFVLAADEAIEISVKGDQPASVSLDGAIGCDVAAGSVVRVGRHPRPLKLVRTGGPRFLERLRIKLGLP